MKRFFMWMLLVTASVWGYAQQNTPAQGEANPDASDPQPTVVTPGKIPCSQPTPAPSDAIILFDGKDLSQWESVNGGEAQWPVANGIVTVKKSLGNIRTKQKFHDFQLHIEWQSPVDVEGVSQSRGNSGIFLQGIYELQVLDSYQNPTYWGGHAGSIYKKAAPLVNATNPPGEWNIYDIIYTAPTFNKDGGYRTYPSLTVFHNGVVIQNNLTIRESLNDAGIPVVRAHGDGPILLQAHRDRTTTEVSYRNIWIREL